MQKISTDPSAPRKGFLQRELHEWFGNPLGDFWGGVVTTLALIPEVIGFTLVAGIPPYMGLFACIILPVFMSFFGGCPALVTGGAGSTILAAVPLVTAYWDTHPEYLFAATFLAGVIMFILGVVRFGSLIRFIPTSVMNGFVNGFATVIFISQAKLCFGDDVNWLMYVLIAVGIAIIYAFPLLQKRVKPLQKIPASFVAIGLITAFTLLSGVHVKTIGDMGSVSASFEHVGQIFARLPQVFTMECFLAILPFSFTIAFTGVMESLLTSRLVDETLQTTSRKNRECMALGAGNVLCSILGSSPGCGMIAMAVTNMKSGGKGRLSTLFIGIFMAILLFTLGFFMEMIPLAALVAVMFTVCFHTVKWPTLTKIYQFPLEETVLMLSTAAVVISTENIPYGVAVGMIIYGLMMAAKKLLPLAWRLPACVLLVAAGAACVWIGWGTVVAMALGVACVCIAAAVRREEGAGPREKAWAAAMIAVGFALVACGIVFVVTGSIFPDLPWFSWGMLHGE